VSGWVNAKAQRFLYNLHILRRKKIKDFQQACEYNLMIQNMQFSILSEIKSLRLKNIKI
jgi:hypothetical protein